MRTFLKRLTYLFYIFYFFIPLKGINSIMSETLIEDKNKYSNIGKENFLTTKKSANEIISFSNLRNIINENNKEILQLKSRIKQANFSLKSKTAKWYPSLKLSSTGVPKYTTGFTNRKIGNNTKTDQVQNDVTASLEWDLYNPSRNSNINSAKLSLEISELDLNKRLKELYFEASKNFFLLQRNLQDIKIAEQSIEIAKVALIEAEGRYNSGIGNKLEVLETSIQLKRDELALRQKIGDFKSTKTELAEILGMEKDIKVDLDERPVIIGYWDSSEDESIDYAIKNRKVLKEIELQIRKNEQDKISAIASYKPTISIYNSFSYQDKYGESEVNNPNPNNNNKSETNTVGLKFNWLLYDGGETKQNYNLYKERKTDLESLYDLNKINIINEIKRNFILVNVSIENIKTAIEQIKSSRESLKISLMRLKAGMSTQREIVNNIGDLAESEGNYIQAVTDYNLNILALEKNTNLEVIKSCNDFYLKRDDSSMNSKFEFCEELSLPEEYNKEIMIDI